MTPEEYRAAVLDVAYLAACGVNGTVPDAARVGRMDLERLCLASERHLLAGVTAMALESAGVKTEAFTQAKGKAVRKVAAFDVERAAVLRRLEEAGVWYAPLKGCVLKSLYPKLGMRQMSDNDILYDATKTAEVRAVMEGLGFSSEGYAAPSLHDHYLKPPVCNFEMHRALFAPGQDPRLVAYYQDVKSRLIRDEGSAFGFHFSDEDFYIYLLAHEFKHYSGSGTGLRSVLDTYVFLKKKGDRLDWPYIAGELEKLGIGDFEAQNRSLALHLFGGGTLTERDREMLELVLSAGAYGTKEIQTKNLIREKGRIGYLFFMAFPPYRAMGKRYPVLEKLPFLLPLCWLLRWGQLLLTKPGKVLARLRPAFRRERREK